MIITSIKISKTFPETVASGANTADRHEKWIPSAGENKLYGNRAYGGFHAMPSKLFKMLDCLEDKALCYNIVSHVARGTQLKLPEELAGLAANISECRKFVVAKRNHREYKLQWDRNYRRGIPDRQAQTKDKPGQQLFGFMMFIQPETEDGE